MASELAAIEASMAEARRARARGDVEGAERWLHDARRASTSLPEDHSIRGIVGWRHVKALYDLERVRDAEDVLLELLELPEPFAAEAGGLRAAEPVARGIWDHLGYGRRSVRRLWERYVAAWSEAGDPWMAASGTTQLLWEWACSGELQQVRDAVEAIACTTPDRFAHGPSKHPRAADAAGSLWFAQMDQARIASWAALWARDAELARDALELYADALAEAELADDYWFVEASARAEIAFGWPGSFVSRWEAEARALVHERAPLHHALAVASLRPAEGVELLAERVPDADRAGPEWGVDVRMLLVALAGDDPRAARWAEEADAHVERFGLDVFRAAGGGRSG